MKVLHVIPSVSAVHGGPSVMVELMARGLTQAGHVVHIATTNDDGQGKLPVACGVPVERNGITHWYFDRQLGFYKYSHPLSRWLAAHVADYQAVHIHALFSHSSYAAGYWAHRRNVPYIVRPLGTLNRWGMENRRPWLKQLSFRFVESRILKNAALVHYTSEAEKTEAAALGVEVRSIVVANPVPEQGPQLSAGQFRAEHQELAGRQIVLFLSRFDRKKGLELLMPAFAEVRKRFPCATLVLAGSGDNALVAELRTQAAGLGITESMVWAGFLQGDAKRAAFADADVFVLPSWSENFGIAVVEAMAGGCPVVVTDQVAIHGDISEAGAGYVTRCDSAAIAEALCGVLADRSARAVLGNKGKCLTQTHYSLEAVTSKLVAAYSAISR
jgi:glycosyltransferase involved in cell wall biosynthesis